MARKKQVPPPEPKVEEDEKPSCYGTYDGRDLCLKQCDYLDSCRRTTGKLHSPTRGLSRSRAIRVFCRSCNGGSSRAGCPDFCCPFYPWLPEHRQLAGAPDLWWSTTPSFKLDEAEREARLQKRKIRKEEFQPGDDVVPEDEEDSDDDDE
jgi:hypothetical protein